MKDKILVFIIGLLVGAILATGCYYFYSKTHTNNHGDRPAMMGGNNTGMPSGTPPEKPSGDQNSSSNGTQGQPPAMPGQQSTDSNTQTTQTTNSNT